MKLFVLDSIEIMGRRKCFPRNDEAFQDTLVSSKQLEINVLKMFPKEFVKRDVY